jgi:actin related protein 2/3 complex, subunit 4
MLKRHPHGLEHQVEEIHVDTFPEFVSIAKVQLNAALCLRRFPPVIEGQEMPQVEVPTSQLLLPSIRINRGKEKETMLIERSINSCRISIYIKQIDDVEKLLVEKFCQYLQHRADDIEIIRKKTLPSYSITFLIHDKHTFQTPRGKIVNFIINFISEITKEINSNKLALKSINRVFVTNIMEGFMSA